MYRVESELEEKQGEVIEKMEQIINKLSRHLEYATEQCSEFMDKAIAAREEQLQRGEEWLARFRKVNDETKKLMAINLDLTRKNGSLQVELNLVCKEALLLRKDALVSEKADIDMKIDVRSAGTLD